jgi:transposase
VLEDANVKLASVATNTVGKSGQAMLDAIVLGEDLAEKLAELALGHLRAKIPQLRFALEGQVREHHRFLLERLLMQWRFLLGEIAVIDQRLEQIGGQEPELMAAVAR